MAAIVSVLLSVSRYSRVMINPGQDLEDTI